MTALGFSVKGTVRRLLTEARNAVLERVVSKALCLMGKHKRHVVRVRGEYFDGYSTRCAECGRWL